MSFRALFLFRMTTSIETEFQFLSPKSYNKLIFLIISFSTYILSVEIGSVQLEEGQNGSEWYAPALEPAIPPLNNYYGRDFRDTHSDDYKWMGNFYTNGKGWLWNRSGMSNFLEVHIFLF